MCEEVDFLRKNALNTIASPRKRKYYVTVKKDDEVIEKFREFFGSRLVGYREAFKGRNYLVEIDGFECDAVKKLAECGAVNITIPSKKKVVYAIVPDEDAIDCIRKHFTVLSVKDAIKGVNYSVKISF